MADVENIVNGGGSEDAQTDENFYDLDQRENEAKVSLLNLKIEAVEHEKAKLVEENTEIKDRVKELMEEIEGLKSKEVALKGTLEGMRKELERHEDGKKTLEAISARALDLETEVSRLQHDLISAMCEGEEANAEIGELKKTLGEKGQKIENLEREMEVLKQAKAETEKKVRELEREVGILEVRGIEERSKRVRVEEEMREKIDEKEREVSGLKNKVEHLEKVVLRNEFELESLIKEKLSLEDALKSSGDKVRTMELDLVELQKKMEEAGAVIGGLKEKAVETINGTANEFKSAINGGENELKALKLGWPTVVGSTGAIAAVIVAVYVLYGKRR